MGHFIDCSRLWSASAQRTPPAPSRSPPRIARVLPLFIPPWIWCAGLACPSRFGRWKSSCHNPDLVINHRHKDIQVWFTRSSAIILCGEDRGVVVREGGQVRENSSHHQLLQNRQAFTNLGSACHDHSRGNVHQDYFWQEPTTASGQVARELLHISSVSLPGGSAVRAVESWFKVSSRRQKLPQWQLTSSLSHALRVFLRVRAMSNLVAADLINKTSSLPVNARNVLT